MVVLNVALIAILGFLVWRWGRDRRVEGVAAARWLRIAGLIALAVPAVTLLLFGIGEVAGGDLSGAMHLVDLAVMVLLGVLTFSLMSVLQSQFGFQAGTVLLYIFGFGIPLLAMLAFEYYMINHNFVQSREKIGRASCRERV